MGPQVGMAMWQWDTKRRTWQQGFYRSSLVNWLASVMSSNFTQTLDTVTATVFISLQPVVAHKSSRCVWRDSDFHWSKSSVDLRIYLNFMNIKEAWGSHEAFKAIQRFNGHKMSPDMTSAAQSALPTARGLETVSRDGGKHHLLSWS